MSRMQIFILAIPLAALLACGSAAEEPQANLETPTPPAVQEAPDVQEAVPVSKGPDVKADEPERRPAPRKVEKQRQVSTPPSAPRPVPESRPEPQPEPEEAAEVFSEPPVAPDEPREVELIRPPAAPRPAAVVIPAGTVIEVRLAEGVSSESKKSGDKFEALLDKELTLNGKAVVPAGSKVTGELLEVRESGRVEGRANMVLALTEIRLGEERYSVETNKIAVEAEGSKERDAKTIGGAAGIGALIGAIAGGKKGAAIGAAIGGGAGTATVLTTKGRKVEFEPEQLFSFRLEKDLEVQAR